MKLRAPGVLILVSALFYLFATVFRMLDGWGFTLASIVIALFTIALLIVSAILSANKNLFLILIGAYLAINILDVFFFDWYQRGLLPTLIGTVLPLNLVLGVQSNSELILDIHLVLLIAGVILRLISKDSESVIQTRSHQTPPLQRPVTRTSVGIEGDAIVQVQKLGELLKQGLITQDEFDTKKKQILGL
jgi:hypothetical protein